MSLSRRRLLFAFFVLLFCILVPIVLLQSTGNTINWRRLSLEKTASVLIDSEPREATVLLNGRKLSNNILQIVYTGDTVTTKAKITGLTPGEYIIRLEHEGYWPWEERFTLSPEEALNFGVINLFKQTEPQLIAESAAENGEFSADKKFFALLHNKTVSIINMETKGTNDFPVTEKSTDTTLLWSKNNRYLFVAGNIIDLENKKVTDLLALTKKNPTLTRWDGAVLYFVNNNALWYYDADNQTNAAINNLAAQTRNENIIDYVVENRKLYLVTKDKNNKSTLWVGNLNQKLISVSLPTANYRFLSEDPTKVVLASERHAYLIDEPLPLLSKIRLLEIPNPVVLGQWRGDSLVYATPFELRQWNGEHNDQLLTRFGSPITALWAMDNAVILSDAESVQIYVTGRQAFSLNMAAIQNISALALSDDNKKILIYGRYQNKQGLFSLEIN